MIRLREYRVPTRSNEPTSSFARATSGFGAGCLTCHRPRIRTRHEAGRYAREHNWL